MQQTVENTLPISVSRQTGEEKGSIEITLVTGQKLFLSAGAARMLACDLIQAAYQAETRNQRRADDTSQNGAATALSIVAAA